MPIEVSLKTPVRFLKGVGPERSKILARVELETLGDLFYFFPHGLGFILVHPAAKGVHEKLHLPILLKITLYRHFNII